MREFVMGARLTLTDDFSNPIREVWRATEQFRQATLQADDSASQLVRELDQLNESQREIRQVTAQATQSIDNATRASQQLANEQQDAQREARQLAESMQQLSNNLNPAASNMQDLNRMLDPAAGNLNQIEMEAQQASRAMQDFTGELTQGTRATSSYIDAAGRLREANGNILTSSRLAASHLDVQRSAVDRLRGAFTGLPALIGAVGGSMAAVGGYNWLIDSNASMEQYQNTLTTVLGSQKEAVDTLSWANKFAAQTPFEIPQIVEATSVMSAYGMSAQDTLGTIGDMASVMGKDLMQAVEAVADAQTGELERLKEFGITKKMIEEQAALLGTMPFDSKGSLQDQEALNEALFAIMEDRYAGGMEIQAKSFNGMLSNAKDFMGTFGRQLGKPIFDILKVQLEGFLAILNNLQASGAIDRFIANVSKFGSTTVKVFSAISPIIQGLAISWAGYGAILLGMQIRTLALTAALYAYRAALLAVNIVMMILRGQFVALWFTMLASPVGLIVTALGLLIGVGLLLYKNWDKVKAAFTATFGFMAPHLEITKNAFIRLGQSIVSFGQSIMASIGPAMDWIGQKFAAAKAWGAGIMAGLGPVGTAIRNSFTSIGNTIATLSPLIARLGLTFLGISGPVGWVIAAVISLGAFLFKLVNNNETVKNSLLNAWNSIKAAVQPLLAVFTQVGQTFLTMLGPAIAQFAAAFATLAPQFQQTGQIIAQSFVALGPSFQQLGAAIGLLVTTVLTLLPQLVPPIVQIATMVFPMLLQAAMMVFPMILTIVQTVLPVIIQLFLTLIPIILQIAMAVIPLILQVVQMVFPIVLQIIMTVIPLVIQIIMSLVPIIMMIVTTVIPLVLQVVQAVFPAVLAIISAVLPVVTTLLTLAAQIITGILVPAIQIILTVVSAVFPVIMGIISGAMTVITGIITAATQAIQGNWEGAWNTIKGTAETIMNGIISFFESIDLVSAGKDIIQGLIDGISSMAGAAMDKAREVASNIKSAVTGFFDINSPSRVFRDEVGKQLGAGMILGMGDTTKGVLSAANNMAAAAMPNLGNIAGPDLSTQLEVATNMQIPTVPGLKTTLDVATEFDGRQAPSYTATAAADVNPAGGQKKKGESGNRSVTFGDININIEGPEKGNPEKIAYEVIEKLQEMLAGADEILGANMEQLL